MWLTETAPPQIEKGIMQSATRLPCAALLLLTCLATSQNEPERGGEPVKLEPVALALDPTCIRDVGGVSRFRREQFITIHASPVDKEMGDQDLDFLLNELEVSYGREGGSRTWRRSQTPADPERPDFPDVDDIRRNGAEARKERRADGRYDPAHWREMILCTHPETFCPWVQEKSAPWGPSSFEGGCGEHGRTTPRCKPPCGRDRRIGAGP